MENEGPFPIHNNPPPVHIMSQINPGHALLHYLKFHFNIIIHLNSNSLRALIM